MHRFFLVGLLLFAACSSRETGAPASAFAQPEADAAPVGPWEAAGAASVMPEATALSGMSQDAPAPSLSPAASGSAAASAASRPYTYTSPVYQTALAEAMQAQRAAVLDGSAAPGTSIFDPPTPFDRQAWERDPWHTALAWCQRAEAARVHQCGRPEDAPLRLRNESLVTIDASAGHVIALHAVPFAVIAAYSADRLVFANGLPYVSLVADADGRAFVPVSVPPGTVNAAGVSLASPVCSGRIQVSFEIQ